MINLLSKYETVLSLVGDEEAQHDFIVKNGFKNDMEDIIKFVQNKVKKLESKIYGRFKL